MEPVERCQEREGLLSQWTQCARRLTKLLLDEQLATIQGRAPSLAGFEEQIRLARAAETEAYRAYHLHVDSHDCV